MKKMSMLKQIQQAACRGTDTKIRALWDAAVVAPENDKRFNQVSEYDIVGTGYRAFGIN